MPELPEVETICRELRVSILHKPIAEVRLLRSDLRYALPVEMVSVLVGRHFTSIERRGKYMLMYTDSEWVLLSHLGMSGNYLVLPHERGVNEPLKHRHVDIVFADGGALIYCDPRRFGFMDLCRFSALSHNKHLRNIGVEPLGAEFDGSFLHGMARQTTRPIKALLLDQACIAGIGNIYACEALWMSAVSPKKHSCKLSKQACHVLADNIRKVLTAAIEKGGSSLRDFKSTTGDMGYFQNQWLCYGREAQPCHYQTHSKKCKGKIKRITQSARSTFYCPKHQR